MIVLASSSASADVVFDSSDRVFIDGHEEFIVLRGEASFSAPLANATVVVTGSDGTDVEGAADAQGRFLVTAAGLAPGTVLSIKARGVGAQSSLEFASTLGDFAFLLDTAGAGRTLTAAQLSALKVNPHQTALHVGMRDLPATVLSPQGRSFALVSGGFNVVDVFFNRGPLVAMMASGAVPLPAGAETTLRAVSDPAFAAQAYAAAAAIPVEHTPGNAWFDAATSLVRDTAQVPVLTAPPFGVTLHSYYPIANGTGGTGYRVTLMQDGTGTFGDESTPISPITWSAAVQPNVFKLVRQDGQPFFASESFRQHPGCNCQVRAVTVTTAWYVQFAQGPRNELMFNYANDSETRYPDNPQLQTDVRAATQARFYYPALSGDVPRAPFEDPSGRTILLPRCMNPNCTPPETITLGFASTFGLVEELHQFAAGGTGATLRIGETFTWVREVDGALSIQYSGGGRARFMVASHDLGYGTLAMVYTTAAGVSVPVSSQFFPASADRRFAEADIVGRSYELAIACDHPFAGVLTDTCGPNFISLIEGQTAGQGTFGGRNSTWMIDGQGRVVWRRLNANGTIFQLRTWEKVSEDAQRLYVIENICGASINPPAGTEPCFEPTGRILSLRKR